MDCKARILIPLQHCARSLHLYPRRSQRGGIVKLKLRRLTVLCGVVGLVANSAGAGVVAPCVGDCNADLKVGVAELVRGVRCVLDGTTSSEPCPGCYYGGGPVDVAAMVRAVNNALLGCSTGSPASPKATWTPVVNGCHFTIDPDSSSFRGCFPDGPEKFGSISVSASSDDCCWSAAVRDPARAFFVELLDGVSACGGGTVEYSVQMSNGTQRGAAIDLSDADQNLVATHWIDQANHCTATPNRTRTPTPLPK